VSGGALIANKKKIKKTDERTLAQNTVFHFETHPAKIDKRGNLLPRFIVELFKRLLKGFSFL